MNDFRAQYEALGIVAILKDLKIRCTSHMWCDEIPIEKRNQLVYDNLLIDITKLGLAYQHEPIALILFNACVAIKNLPSLPLSQVLSKYKTLVDHHLAQIQRMARHQDEYREAHILLVSFAHSAFECNNKVDILSILAEESTRGISNKPSLLHVYHNIWSTLFVVQ